MLRNSVLLALSLSFAVIFFVFGAPVNRAQNVQYQKMDLKVTKFLASPTDEAASVYDFPVSIRITGRTPDKKWYKIRLSYNFIAYFEYEGWVKVE